MVKSADQGLIRSKHKAIYALFPYAVRLGRSGNQRVVGVFLRAVMALNPEELIWDRAKPLIVRLSNTQSPPSIDWLIIVASPHMFWDDELCDGNMVARWATAASAVPYTEDVGQSVVDTLLHIASVDFLRPHILVGIWTWLKKQPFLPPECLGRSRGTSGDVVRQVRALGDAEVLKSYLFLVWSEWNQIYRGLAEMEVSIREDFEGIEMWRHREDLIRRLDHVLGQLDRPDHLQQRKPTLYRYQISDAKTQYSELRAALLEVDVEAMNALARKPTRLIFSDLLTPTNTYRIPPGLHVRPASTMSIVHSLRSTISPIYWLSYYIHVSLHSPYRLTLRSGF